MGTEVKTIHEALIPFALVGAEMDESTNFSFTFRDARGQNFARLDKSHFVDAFTAYSATFDNRFIQPPKVEVPVIEVTNRDIEYKALIARYRATNYFFGAGFLVMFISMVIAKLGG